MAVNVHQMAPFVSTELELNAERIFRHTFIVKWMNNNTDLHSAVEKGLFWVVYEKKGIFLVGKQRKVRLT